jgi:hypothetical protein
MGKTKRKLRSTEWFGRRDPIATRWCDIDTLKNAGYYPNSLALVTRDLAGHRCSGLVGTGWISRSLLESQG